MAYISVRNTFTTGDDLDATEVNDNFNDIINGLTDSTKDLKVAALTGNALIVSTTQEAVSSASCSSLSTKNLVSTTITAAEMFSKILSLSAVSVTMATNTLTPTGSLVEVNGEGGLADNLDTIDALTDGTLLVLYKKSTSGTITIKHNTGNILCGSDKTLSANSTAILIYDGTATKWNLLFHQVN